MDRREFTENIIKMICISPLLTSCKEENTKITSKKIDRNKNLNGIINVEMIDIGKDDDFRLTTMGNKISESNNIIFIYGEPHGDEPYVKPVIDELMGRYLFDSTVIIADKLNETGKRNIDGLDPNRVWGINPKFYKNSKNRAELIAYNIDKLIIDEIVPFIEKDFNQKTLTAIPLHTAQNPKYKWKTIVNRQRDLSFAKDIAYKINEDLSGFGNIKITETSDWELGDNNERESFTAYFSRIADEIYEKNNLTKNNSSSRIIAITIDGSKTDKINTKKVLLTGIEKILEFREIKYAKIY